MAFTGDPADQFQQAQDAVAGLTNDPGNEVKLVLYGLFKQATAGDVSGKRPRFTDPVGRAKYDAWAAFSGLSAEQAQQQYADKVAELL